MAVYFGVDLDCLDDLTEGMREIAGAAVVAQDCYRRLITPRGQLLDEPDYGFDLAELLSRWMTPEQVAAIPGLVRAELSKDERIDSVTVSAVATSEGTVRLTIKATTGAGPFVLGVDASPSAVNLLEITV